MSWTLQIDLASYWQSATGRGQLANADSQVLRDAVGLPMLSGRTVKGLLRHAVAELEGLGHAEPGTVERLFGRGDAAGRVGDARPGARETLPGLLRIGSATMPETWVRYAGTEQGRLEVQHLFSFVSSTALEGGTAKDGSLRTVEVAAPVSLTAAVRADGPLAPADVQVLRLAAGLIRGIGSRRTRGFGRADARFEGGDG